MNNLYLFFGEEDFLIKEDLDAMRSKYSDPANPFSSENIDAVNSSTDKIVNTLMAAPMLGGGRFIVISDILKAPAGGKKAKPAFDQDKIIAALKARSPEDVIVIYQYGTVDRRVKLVKFLEENGTAKEFKPFAFWEQDKVIDWVVSRVSKNGRKIGAHAAEALVDIAGSNMRMLDGEIEKLITYIGDKEHIEPADVQSVAASGEIDVFAFSNSVRSRNVVEAMKNLDDLFKDKESPAMMLSMLARLFRMLLQVKSLEKRGLDQYGIAQELGAKPFFIKKHMERTRLFTMEELKKGIRKLYAADLRIKSGADPRVTLELLVSDLCGQKAER